MNINSQTHYAEFVVQRKTIKIVGLSEEDVRLQLDTLNRCTVNSDIKIKELVEDTMSYDSEFDIDLQNKADEVKEATGNNQHTEAYRLICEFLGLKDTASKLEAIQEVQQREGYLPFSEYEKRQHIYNYMNMQGIDILGKEAYDKYFYQNT